MRVDVLQAQVRESKARYEASLDDKTESEIIREENRYINSQYMRALERQNKLIIKARDFGTLVIPANEDLEGRFIERGEILGYIVDFNKLPLTVMIAEDDIEQVMNGTRRIELRFVSHPDDLYTGRIKRIMPNATQSLVSPVLSVGGGGKIALKPGTSEPNQTFEHYYHMEIDVPEAPKFIVEERVYIMFKHDPEPVIKRWYRSIRRVFLRQFDA